MSETNQEIYKVSGAVDEVSELLNFLDSQETISKSDVRDYITKRTEDLNDRVAKLKKGEL